MGGDMAGKKRQAPRVADTIAMCLKASTQSQAEIAVAAGLDERVMEALKAGAMKVPLNKVVDLGRALGLDPYDFLEQVCEEYMPDTWRVIKQVIPGWASHYERGVIEAYRKLAQGTDIPVTLCKAGTCVEIRPH